MVVIVVHACEVEEADAWTWGVGSSISTLEASFSGAQQMMLHQPWLSRLVSWETVVAIFGSDVGCVHNCCIRSTSGTLGHHDWEGCGTLVATRFGHQYLWGALLGNGLAGRSMVEGANVVGSRIAYKLRCIGQ